METISLERVESDLAIDQRALLINEARRAITNRASLIIGDQELDIKIHLSSS